MPVIFWSVAVVALLVSWRLDPELTKKALGISGRSLKGLVPGVLGMVSLVGLVLALLMGVFL